MSDVVSWTLQVAVREGRLGFSGSLMHEMVGSTRATRLDVYGDPSEEARAVLDRFGAARPGWFGGFRG